MTETEKTGKHIPTLTQKIKEKEGEFERLASSRNQWLITDRRRRLRQSDACKCMTAALPDTPLTLHGKLLKPGQLNQPLH